MYDSPQVLSEGAIIVLNNGKTCTVKSEIGRGSQGIVYVVEYDGKEYALKWYIQQYPDAFYDNLCRNVIEGSPAENFLWPIVVTERQKGSFGYIMDLRPSEYEDMNKFLLLHARFSSVQAQLNACLQICTAFQKLHIRGLSYQDMSDKNFFINPINGNVLICDNDNVAPDGTYMGILGTAGYMAPEIVEGDSTPNRLTDYYSLSVCLFILIYMNRPFEGERYLSCPCDNNPEYSKKLFGYESVFIMDKNDSSNRPNVEVHKNVIRRWNLYPHLLSEAFCKTFSKEAICKPSLRVIDKQWQNILIQVRSLFVTCPTCGNDTFVADANNGSPCAWCKSSIGNNPLLQVGKFRIPLVPDQVLYGCQVANQEDLDSVVAETIVKNKQIGLFNLSSTPWTVMLPDGQVRIVDGGSSMPVKVGYEIKFGNTGENAIII